MVDSVFDPNQLPMPDLGLVCRDCGYPLAYATEHRCPECGWRFEVDDLVPPGEFPALYADGREVRGTPQVVNLLKRYQVPFIALADPSVGVFGLVRTSSQVGDPLAVPRERYLEVIDLLRRSRQDEAMPPAPERVNPDKSWTCSHCAESNPGHFQVCWNCQQPADD